MARSREAVSWGAPAWLARRPVAVGPVAVALVAVGLVVAGAAGCERPPVGPPPTEPPQEGRVGPVAFETFVQDRPAIAGKWYDYNPDGHTLDPKPQAWIVRDTDPDTGAARFASFRVVSIYDADTADSGVFTLATATWDGAAWGAESSWTASKNIKLEGPVCLDLFGDVEADCASDAWQVRFAIFQYFSPLAGIAVADPGIFVRSVDGTDAFGDVRIAREDGVTALADLPDPSALGNLEDAPPPAYDGTDWDFGKLGPDLPRAGMALGSRFVDDGFTGRDDVWWLMSFRYELARLQVRPVADGDPSKGLRFTFASVAMERSDSSIPDTFPEAHSVDVPLPAVGDASWLTLTTPDLQLAAADLDGASYPFAPPKTTRWDFAIERPADGDVRLLLSPSACTLNATQLGIDEDVPPVDSP